MDGDSVILLIGMFPRVLGLIGAASVILVLVSVPRRARKPPTTGHKGRGRSPDPLDPIWRADWDGNPPASSSEVAGFEVSRRLV